MDVAKWIALVIAVLGLALILTDLLFNIKKRRNTKLNVIGLVFLTVSLICFILVQFVFKDSLPSIFQLMWIPFLAGYVVCDIIAAISIGKQNSAKKKAQSEQADAEQAEEQK